MQETSKNTFFEPFFVLGAPRSGTTMFAVLLDRHSEISIPPETQFYTEFLPLVKDESLSSSREEKITHALNFKRIADLQLNKSELLEQFDKHENTYPELLRSILEVYAQKKAKKRFGEKSPKHLEHVPLILKNFPNAKIICIVRDGRDVVRSLLKVPWAEPGNKRRFEIFCMEWQDLAILGLQYEKTLSANKFLLIKYEDLMLSPESTMQTVCDFIGVQYEPTMLQPTNKTEEGVVPEWESQWKEKANKGLDPSRVKSWKKEADKEEIWSMNVMMGPALKKLNYTDTDLDGCPIFKRVLLYVRKLPYTKAMRPYSLLLLKFIRFFKK